MDGTLWDATASYSAIWDVCLSEFGIGCSVSPAELIGYMGLTMDEIINRVSARHEVMIDVELFQSRIGEIEDEMMPRLGGRLYDGVAEGLKCLSERYRLFLLSNCSRLGLKNFMKYNHLESYFSGSLSYGERCFPKAENLKYLIAQERLGNPVYVGDTQSDCDQTHKAGIPFVYVEYGFGSCDRCERRFSSFAQLTRHFIDLKD